MTGRTFEQKSNFAQGKTHVNTLLDQLKRKLNQFTVKDEKGQTLGQVIDVTLDPNRQVSLVVMPPETAQNSEQLLFGSQHIEHIDALARTLFLDIDYQQVEHLQEQMLSDMVKQEMPINRNGEITVDSPHTSTEATAASKAIAQDVDSHTLLNEMATPSSFPFGESAETMKAVPPPPLPTAGTDVTPEKVVDEKTIRLLEERLDVDLQKRKLGEVIIRKEIETRLIQVPVRREKLIVEQVGSAERLAEIDLGEDQETAGVEFANAQPMVQGEFPSLKAAIMVLDAIARHNDHGCKSVRVELVLNDPSQQATYQTWFDQCTGKS